MPRINTLTTLLTSTFASALAAASTPASASSVPAQAACAVFEQSDLGGAAWGVPAAGPSASSAAMTPWWQGRAKSVWVKAGYALDGYSEPTFFGEPLVIEPGQANSHSKDGGTYVNLRDGDKIASFRCHPVATPVWTVLGQIPWINGAEYTWRPDASVAEYSSVKTQQEGSDFVVEAAYHGAQDAVEYYQINLSKGTVKAWTKNAQGHETSASFNIKDSPSPRVNPSYQAIAASAYGIINMQVSGMHSDSSPSAPAPELAPMADALSATLWPVQH